MLLYRILLWDLVQRSMLPAAFGSTLHALHKTMNAMYRVVWGRWGQSLRSMYDAFSKGVARSPTSTYSIGVTVRCIRFTLFCGKVG